MTRPALRTTAAVTGGAALLLGGALGLGTAASAADGTGCSTGALPPVVEGNPNVKPGQAGGAYLFHDANGFHLRVTHATSSKLAVQVRLDAASLSHVRPVALERADRITMTGDGKTVIVQFVNYGKVDGIDFSADCSRSLKVHVLFNGKQAAARQVKLGSHRSSPTSVPFVLQRYAPASHPTATATATPTATATASAAS